MKTSTSQRGSYLVMAAFILVVLMIVGALAVDVARKYRLEQIAQDVADAAALAGAAQLPDEEAGRLAAMRYIQQFGTDSYVPSPTDIQITVSPDNQSGTCGVIVYGAWDAIFMPMWLTGDPQYGISRYAVAVSFRELTSETRYMPGDFSNAPTGPYALFVGDSNTAISSDVTGNSMQIIGGAHFNHAANFSSSNGSEILGGTLEATSLSGSVAGTMQVPTGYEEPPTIDRSKLVSDVTLDISQSNQAAYYQAGVEVELHRPGADGLYGTADDIPVRQNDGSAIKVTYQGGNIWNLSLASHNVGVGATNNAGVGNGLDLSVVGDLNAEIPGSNAGGDQINWIGSIVCSGRFTNDNGSGGNNSEIRAVTKANAAAGLDNAGIAVYSGYSNPGGLTFDNGGNALNIYGLLSTDGTLLWTGNMSNPSSSSPTGGTGTAPYDAVGNGFIKGAVVCRTFDTNQGGGVQGNNVKIWYDGTLTQGPPITDALVVTPPRYSSPRITLIK